MQGQSAASTGSLVQRVYSLAALLGMMAVAHLSAETTPGLQQQNPESGRSVKTDRGYMVPYTVVIPGTTVKYTMQPVPAGTVRVGSPATEKGRDKNEGPQFDVKVAPFWIGQYEVSWAEFLRYMAMHDIFKDFETRKLRPITPDHVTDVITAPSNLYDPTFTFVNGEDPDLPAVTMSQYSAKQYTKWLSLLTNRFYRLPSEAEWEHACRAGSKSAFHFGDDPSRLDEYGWHYDNANDTTHPVGKKKPNAWGLHDMHGNVAEWVLDELADGAYEKRAAAGKPITVAEAIAWPKKLFPRVVKGGSWDMDASDCRVAARLASQDDDWRSEDPNIPLSPWWFTSGPSLGVGMRILRPLTPVEGKQRQRFWEPMLDQIIDDVKYRIDDEGRGARGIVDPSLPAEIEKLKK